MDQDCMRKKFKGKVFKYHTNKINNLNRGKFKIKNIVKKCTSNITKKLNIELLNKLMYDIYKDYSNLNKLNSKSKGILITKESTQFNITFKQVIENYINSEDFEKDIDSESIEYKKKYKDTASNFIAFYEKSKNNKQIDLVLKKPRKLEIKKS